MSEIAEDICKSAYRALGASFDLHGDICAEILAERNRCIGLLRARYDALIELAYKSAQPLPLRASAAELLDLIEAIKDGAVAAPVGAHPDTLTDEAKARRSKALDELGALDGELI